MEEVIRNCGRCSFCVSANPPWASQGFILQSRMDRDKTGQWGRRWSEDSWCWWERSWRGVLWQVRQHVRHDAGMASCCGDTSMRNPSATRVAWVKHLCGAFCDALYVHNCVVRVGVLSTEMTIQGIHVWLLEWVQCTYLYEYQLESKSGASSRGNSSSNSENQSWCGWKVYALSGIGKMARRSTPRRRKSLLFSLSSSLNHKLAERRAPWATILGLRCACCCGRTRSRRYSTLLLTHLAIHRAVRLEVCCPRTPEPRAQPCPQVHGQFFCWWRPSDSRPPPRGCNWLRSSAQRSMPSFARTVPPPASLQPTSCLIIRLDLARKTPQSTADHRITYPANHSHLAGEPSRGHQRSVDTNLSLRGHRKTCKCGPRSIPSSWWRNWRLGSILKHLVAIGVWSCARGCVSGREHPSVFSCFVSPSSQPSWYWLL